MPTRSVVFEVPEILEALQRTTLVTLDPTIDLRHRNPSGTWWGKSRASATSVNLFQEAGRRLALSLSARDVVERRRRFSAEQKVFEVGLRDASIDRPEFPSPPAQAVISSARLPDWQGIARFHDEKRRNETARRPS